MSTTSTDLSHAFSLHQSGRIEEARRVYNQLLELGDNAEALHWLGVLELQVGNAQEALALLEQAAQLDPSNPQVFANLGNAFSALSQFTEARVALESSLRLNPESPESLASLGNVCLSLQANLEAIRYYERALKFNPALPEVWRCLATALSATGRNRSALNAVRKAESQCANAGQNVPLPIILSRGNVLFAMGLPDQAVDAFQQVVDAAPAFAHGHVSLANAHRELGSFGIAAEHYQQAIQMEPDNAEAYSALGVLRQDEGDLEQAKTLFQKSIQIDPLNGKAHRLLASLTGFESGHPGIAFMESSLANSSSNEQRKHFGFGLGKAYEDCGEYDRAFEHLHAANKLHRTSIEYSIERDVDEMRRIAQTIDADFIRKSTVSGAADNGGVIPIFVVGMPRSGTSLIEQILASHPDVYGAGELDWFERIVDQVATTNTHSMPSSYVSGVRQYTIRQVEEIGKAYRQRMTSLPQSRWIVDKMPANFRHAGLIRAALPEAVIVHSQRHPMATCWSIYKLFLGKTGHAYSFDLDELGQYYVAYKQLMQHWQEAIVSPEMVSVQYEALVSDQEAKTRELIRRCGLEWNDSCLDFHNTPRPVKTLSAAQVRRPIYADAVAQWKHYSRQLEPLLKMLGE